MPDDLFSRLLGPLDQDGPRLVLGHLEGAARRLEIARRYAQAVRPLKLVSHRGEPLRRGFWILLVPLQKFPEKPATLVVVGMEQDFMAYAVIRQRGENRRESFAEGVQLAMLMGAEYGGDPEEGLVERVLASRLLGTRVDLSDPATTT